MWFIMAFNFVLNLAFIVINIVLGTDCCMFYINVLRL